jgi:hypothetical protein
MAELRTYAQNNHTTELRETISAIIGRYSRPPLPVHVNDADVQAARSILNASDDEFYDNYDRYFIQFNQYIDSRIARPDVEAPAVIVRSPSLQVLAQSFDEEDEGPIPNQQEEKDERRRTNGGDDAVEMYYASTDDDEYAQTQEAVSQTLSALEAGEYQDDEAPVGWVEVADPPVPRRNWIAWLFRLD